MKFFYSIKIKPIRFIKFFFKKNSLFKRFSEKKTTIFYKKPNIKFKFLKFKKYQKRFFYFKKIRKKKIRFRKTLFFRKKFPKIIILFFKVYKYFFKWTVPLKLQMLEVTRNKYNIFVNLFFINFLRKLFFFKFSILFNNSYFIPNFIFKKLKYFIFKNKRYIRVLKGFFFFKTFFILFFFTIFYKNISIFSNFLKKFITYIPIKKQRFFYYFLRYNISKFFRKFLKKFFIAGLFLRIRGKYATFSGGRRKLFYIKYLLSTKTNYALLYKYKKTQHSTKLGAFGLKILILFF